MKQDVVVVENHSMSDRFLCYNCQNEHIKGTIFCSKCHFIQPITVNNYFALFNLEEQFDLDLSELEQAYLKLQQLLHPDKFITKTKTEQILALKHSSLINNAYDILKYNLSRSEYLLQLHNIIINQDTNNNIKADIELLEEIMELRNSLDEAEQQVQIEEMVCSQKRNKIAIIARIRQYFTDQNYRQAAIETIRLRYINKLIADIELKLSMLRL